MTVIVGIGLDLIDLAHFKIHYGDGDAELLARCFTQEEVTLAGDGVDRIAKLAARFAVKEAAYKALGGGVGFALTDIECLPGDSGQPQLSLHGAAKKMAQQRGADQFYVSLTHSPSSAAAVVIAVSSGPT